MPALRAFSWFCRPRNVDCDSTLWDPVCVFVCVCVVFNVEFLSLLLLLLLFKCLRLCDASCFLFIFHFFFDIFIVLSHGLHFVAKSMHSNMLFYSVMKCVMIIIKNRRNLDVCLQKIEREQTTNYSNAEGPFLWCDISTKINMRSIF